MKAISVRQPWAWLIIHGGKNIENRKWRCNHRGPLLIHAAKGCSEEEYLNACVFCEMRGLPEPPPLKTLHRGGIVGVVYVTGCTRASRSPWFEGPFGIEMKYQEPFDFFPCKGQLGLFDVTLPIEEKAVEEP